MAAIDEERRADRGRRVPASVLLVLATLFWAGNFVVGRPLSEALPPFGITLVRWLLACLILVPLTVAREGRLVRPERALWPALAGMAVTGVLLFNTLVYAALGETTSVNAALVNATTPILTLLLIAGLSGTRPPIRAGLGALLGLAGVGWIVADGQPLALLGQGPNRGDLAMLLAAALWAVYTVLAQSVTRRITPLAATTASTLLALPPLAVFGGAQLVIGPTGPITPLVIAGLLYVGIFASVAAFLAWNGGIARMGADRGAIFLNLIPVFTAAIAVPVVGDRLGPAQVVGGVLVVGGVSLAAWRGARPGRGSPRRTGPAPPDD